VAVDPPARPHVHDTSALLDRISKLEAQCKNSTCDPSALLDRISKLEELCKSSSCYDLEVKVQALTTSVDVNKKEIDANRSRLAALEQQLKDVALGLQRITGAAEIMQKEVIGQNKKIGVLDQQGKDTALRIQRLESSSAALTTRIEETNETLKGKLHFRLRVDQSGRVVGVDAQ
jgi:chromosome segregation ATPase